MGPLFVSVTLALIFIVAQYVVCIKLFKTEGWFESKRFFVLVGLNMVLGLGVVLSIISTVVSIAITLI